jgi:hypothetical protein
MRADVPVGQPLNFGATLGAPPNTGKIISAKWDFESDGKFAAAEIFKGTKDQVRLNTNHTFSKPGTYFVTLLVASQRNGEPPPAGPLYVHNVLRLRGA